jgi:K+-transporting ATPase ATPase A chain
MAVLYAAESNGNPLLGSLNLTGPYMEGKEVRNGLGQSALFAAATTGTSTGAVNNMHDSLTPLGGMVPLFLILTGEVLPGGVGSGLYTMLAYVIIGVFIAGLMIGRTPEYLGKKIEALEMRGSIVVVLASGLLVLVFSGIALVISAGTSAIANPGPHGLTEIVYAFASMSNNNGSAFAGLGGNTLFYNLAGAFCMFVGRFAPAIAVLAMAGSLAAKKHYQITSATLPTHKPAFVIWLIFVILLLGVISFFSVLAVGPLVEHLIMTQGGTF